MRRNAGHFLAAVLPVLAACMLSTHVAAQSIPAHPPTADDALTHSLLSPHRLLWPGVVIIVVLAIFVTAALAGPLIRANSDDDASDPDADIRNRSDSLS